MSPKEEFLENLDLVGRHKTTVAKRETREALLVAFNELCWSLPPADNPQSSWAANARRQGAQDLIRIFLGLANQQQPRKPLTAGRLENEDANSNRSAPRSD